MDEASIGNSVVATFLIHKGIDLVSKVAMQVVYLLVGVQTESLAQQVILFLIIAEEENVQVVWVE